MRHAKAEPFGAEDHARRLTERGRRDATEAGAWLAAEGIVPTHALVSAAARTIDTWEAVAEASGSIATPTYDDSLYSAGPDTALDVLVGCDPDAEVLLVVGHNPTAAYLAQFVADGQPDPEAFRAMSQGYPPAALAVFDVPVPWTDLTEGSARLTAFHVGHA